MTPYITFIVPPERFALEFRAIGSYALEISRNGVPDIFPSFAPSDDYFLHFGDIYSPPRSTLSDLGFYRVGLLSEFSRLVNHYIDFFVLQQG